MTKTILRKKSAVKDNAAVVTESLLDAFKQDNYDTIEAELLAYNEQKAINAAWEAEEKKRAARNKATGKTINGARPIRPNAKMKRYEAILTLFPTVEKRLIHLFINTAYASGDAAAVIKAFGYNLAGDNTSAIKSLAAQKRYTFSRKTATRWAREELRCIGIFGLDAAGNAIDRHDLINTMIIGFFKD